jgi:uncharacterized protein YdcH (DUF465 family)
MRKRVAKSYLGELEQTKKLSPLFQKRQRLFYDRITKIEEEMRKLKPNSPEFNKLAEKKDQLGAAIGRFDLRVHPQEVLNVYKETYNSFSPAEKQRVNIRHRLIRDSAFRAMEEETQISRKIRALKKEYAHATSEKERDVIQMEIERLAQTPRRQQVLKERIADLAACIKLVTGMDDSAAIKKAFDIASRQLDKNPQVILDIADDVFFEGKNSKYLKPLNNARRKPEITLGEYSDET